MRILAIGLGGAGGRITEALYANDRKSSKVTCVQAFAVDTDGEALARLKVLPESAKLDFSAIEPDISGQGSPATCPAEIDTGEILARIQNIERNETDAILFCCGLGGSMMDAVPPIITALRESVTEPIFGLVTLPALSEGERRSAKAADDIDAISPLLDGIILFDNETWLKKVASRRDALVKELAKGPGLFGLGGKPPQLTPEEITNKLLNQSIVRRISLLLRAGEFRADGGIDLAEVVLDSSEVLNTIRGMGFISIGYAVENISQGPLAFLARFRSGDSAQEQRKSAERIIELAKKAIYQEVSIPCDMTSAAKALILIAGPSHEISMKGFMTVRKWIDRSIAGMEMRSGDYPVTNSENVAIIVVLSGLENIPRITEIHEIRDQNRTGIARSSDPSLDLPPGRNLQTAGGVSAVTTVWSSSTEVQDEMITLPGEPVSTRVTHNPHEPVEDLAPRRTPARVLSSPSGGNHRHEAVRPHIQEENRPGERRLHSPAPEQNDRPVEPAASREIPPRVPSEKNEPKKYTSDHRTGYSASSSSHEAATGLPVKRTLESGYEGSLPLKRSSVQRKTPFPPVPSYQDQQKPVKPEIPETRDTPSPQRVFRSSETKTIVRKIVAKPTLHTTAPPHEVEGAPPVQSPKMIIRHKKKKPTPEAEPERLTESSSHAEQVHQEELEPKRGEDTVAVPTQGREAIPGIGERPQPAHDDIFLGKAIPKKTPLQVKDAALLQAELKPRKIRFVTSKEGLVEESDTSISPAPRKKGRDSPDENRA